MSEATICNHLHTSTPGRATSCRHKGYAQWMHRMRMHLSLPAFQYIQSFNDATPRLPRNPPTPCHHLHLQPTRVTYRSKSPICASRTRTNYLSTECVGIQSRAGYRTVDASHAPTSHFQPSQTHAHTTFTHTHTHTHTHIHTHTLTHINPSSPEPPPVPPSSSYIYNTTVSLIIRKAPCVRPALAPTIAQQRVWGYSPVWGGVITSTVAPQKSRPPS